MLPGHPHIECIMHKQVSKEKTDQSLNTIDTFSVICIILLDKHPIYRVGRKFVSYKKKTISNLHTENDIEKWQNVPKNQKNGKSLHKVYIASEEKKDSKLPLRPLYQQNDLK